MELVTCSIVGNISKIRLFAGVRSFSARTVLVASAVPIINIAQKSYADLCTNALNWILCFTMYLENSV